NAIPDHFAFISAADVDSPWWQELKKLQPNILEEESASGNFTTAGFARRLLGPEVEITFETQFTCERNTDYYLALRKNFGLALDNAWAPDLPGDYNNDGQVDATDYTVWRNALGTGAELPNDDTPGVGIDDYERWKERYGSTAVDAASV